MKFSHRNHGRATNTPVTGWRLVLLIVLVLALLAGFNYLRHGSAFGAEVPAHGRHHGPQAAAARCLPGNAEVACVSSAVLAKRFRNDRLGHSTGLRVPLRIRRMANREAANRNRTANLTGEYDGKWWNNPITGKQCAVGIFNGAYPDCVNQKEQTYSTPIKWSDVQDVAIDCSGSALLGFIGDKAVGGRGWIGLGLGGANCLWSTWRHANR